MVMMESLTCKQLKDFCKASGLKGYSALNKAPLIAFMEEQLGDITRADVLGAVITEPNQREAPVARGPVKQTKMSSTFNGYNFDDMHRTLKMCIQFGYFSGEFKSDKEPTVGSAFMTVAIYSAIELDLLSLNLDSRNAKDVETSKTQRISMVQGLMVSLMNNVSTLNMSVVNYMMAKYDAWIENFNKPINSSEGKHARHCLINMVSILANTKKDRIISDIRATYFTSDRYANIISGDPCMEFLADVEEVDADINPVEFEEFEEMQETLDGLLSGLKTKSYKIFHWVNETIRTEDGRGINSAGVDALFKVLVTYANTGSSLWEDVEQVMDEKLVQGLDVIWDLYCDMEEHPDCIVFIIGAVLMCISDPSWETLDDIINEDEVDALYQNNMGKKKIDNFEQYISKAPDVIATMDVKARAKIEDAIIKNDVDEVYNPDYRKMFEIVSCLEAGAKNMGQVNAILDPPKAVTPESKPRRRVLANVTIRSRSAR